MPKNRHWRPAGFLRLEAANCIRLQPTSSITKLAEMGPFGLNLSVMTMENSRILDCLVRIAVLREPVSLEIPAFPQN
jgi:hypothetical protein